MAIEPPKVLERGERGEHHPFDSVDTFVLAPTLFFLMKLGDLEKLRSGQPLCPDFKISERHRAALDHLVMSGVLSYSSKDYSYSVRPGNDQLFDRSGIETVANFHDLLNEIYLDGNIRSDAFRKLGQVSAVIRASTETILKKVPEKLKDAAVTPVIMSLLHFTDSLNTQEGTSLKIEDVIDSGRFNNLLTDLVSFLKAMGYSDGVGLNDKGRALAKFAGHCMMSGSYLGPLWNLYEFEIGEKSYGGDAKTSRNPRLNAEGSGAMFRMKAQRNIVKEVGKLVDNLPADVPKILLGFGSGDGSLEAEALKNIPGISAAFVTDINPGTQGPARDVFKRAGLTDKLRIEQCDLADPVKLRKIAEKIEKEFPGANVIVHIGYIFHEVGIEKASICLNSLKELFGQNLTLIVTEYWLQPLEKVLKVSKIPGWFQTLHKYFNQTLYDRAGFVRWMKFVMGFMIKNEVKHSEFEDPDKNHMTTLNSSLITSVIN